MAKLKWRRGILQVWAALSALWLFVVLAGFSTEVLVRHKMELATADYCKDVAAPTGENANDTEIIMFEAKPLPPIPRAGYSCWLKVEGTSTAWHKPEPPEPLIELTISFAQKILMEPFTLFIAVSGLILALNGFGRKRVTN